MSSSGLAGGVWPVMLTPFREDGSIDWRGVDALTDWYLAGGAAGLFTVCLSSEMYQLTEVERLALAARVVQRAGGRAPVVASGTFGGPLEEQAQFVRRMAETGVDAVVILCCQVAPEGADDAALRASLERLLEWVPETRLGLYECPTPYHRLASAETMGWAAATGRFVFHKDTCCRMEAIRAKVSAVRGSPLRFLNAHAPTLLGSLEVGGDGFCGIDASFHPHLLAWLCRHHADRPAVAARLQRYLTVADMAIRNRYPASAKAFIRMTGLDITPVCRVRQERFTEHDLLVLEHLLGLARDVTEELGIAWPW